MSAASSRKAVRDRDGAVGLRYVGQGAALPDVPARDLSADEVAALHPQFKWPEEKADDVFLTHDWLVVTGLYVVNTAPALPAESE